MANGSTIRTESFRPAYWRTSAKNEGNASGVYVTKGNTGELEVHRVGVVADLRHDYWNYGILNTDEFLVEDTSFVCSMYIDSAKIHVYRGATNCACWRGRAQR